MMPSAPGRFSTITDWPQRLDKWSASSRAVTSAPLPGPSGTINLTVRCGQCWASDAAPGCAGTDNPDCVSTDKKPTTPTRDNVFIMSIARPKLAYDRVTHEATPLASG